MSEAPKQSQSPQEEATTAIIKQAEKFLTFVGRKDLSIESLLSAVDELGALQEKANALEKIYPDKMHFFSTFSNALFTILSNLEYLIVDELREAGRGEDPEKDIDKVLNKIPDGYVRTKYHSHVIAAIANIISDLEFKKKSKDPKAEKLIKFILEKSLRFISPSYEDTFCRCLSMTRNFHDDKALMLMYRDHFSKGNNSMSFVFNVIASFHDDMSIEEMESLMKTIPEEILANPQLSLHLMEFFAKKDNKFLESAIKFIPRGSITGDQLPYLMVIASNNPEINIDILVSIVPPEEQGTLKSVRVKIKIKTILEKNGYSQDRYNLNYDENTEKQISDFLDSVTDKSIKSYDVIFPILNRLPNSPELQKKVVNKITDINEVTEGKFYEFRNIVLALHPSLKDLKLELIMSLNTPSKENPQGEVSRIFQEILSYPEDYIPGIGINELLGLLERVQDGELYFRSRFKDKGGPGSMSDPIKRNFSTEHFELVMRKLDDITREAIFERPEEFLDIALSQSR